MKPCRDCGLSKPTTEFYRHASTRDGLQATCKACHAARGQAWKTRNRARVRERAAEYRARHADQLRAEGRRRAEQGRRAAGMAPQRVSPCDGDQKLCLTCQTWKPLERFALLKHRPGKIEARCKDCRAAAMHARRATQPAYKAQAQAYYVAHKSEIAARLRLYHLANPEARRVNEARRRAAKRALPSTVTRADLAAAVEAFGGACAYCLRTDVELTTDHVVAIARGGPDTPDNIVPACRSCNSRKGDRGVLYMLNKCASASRAPTPPARADAQATDAAAPLRASGGE